MPRRSNRLIFLILTLTALSLGWGCTQPKDVISDVSSTRLTLIAERLPTLPAGMDYELWVSDINGDDISLGKFKYDQVNRVFLEIDRTPRGNEFTLEDDLLKQYWDEETKQWKYWFTKVFVSVENNPDDNGASRGPIMLEDVVTEPTDDQIELRFQNKTEEAIGDATVRFNLESVSDGNRSTASVGQGLWFTSYREVSKDLPDTLHFDVALIPDTIEAEWGIVYDENGDSIGVEITNRDEIFVMGPRSILSEGADTTEIVFGPDTVYLGNLDLQHISYSVEFLKDTPTVAPYVLYTPVFSNWDTVPRTVILDLFSQDDFNLPDYGPDWHYKGWVVSATARTVDISNNPTATLLSDFITARFTPPAWRYNTPTYQRIPGDTGALISTGTFSYVDSVDDGNPYVLDPLLVPQYPGEDFLNTSALFDSFGVAEKFDLIPNSGPNSGAVFISIEPSNFNANTNFPLIAFGKALPSTKSLVWGTFVQENMSNWTQTINTDQTGFPQITVEVETF